MQQFLVTLSQSPATIQMHLFVFGSPLRREGYLEKEERRKRKKRKKQKGREKAAKYSIKQFSGLGNNDMQIIKRYP